MTARTWFITGASRGFGREWTLAALERGDAVVATARRPEMLNDLTATYGDRTLLVLPLDVTDHAAATDAVHHAEQHFGGLDIVVNNAGYGQFGMVEEISEAEARAQMETNFFGALWVTQAALPFLRERRRGHIIQVSSIGGISAFANVGMYHASKWALEGLSQSLSLEVAEFDIAVTIVEPGAYATDWGGSSARHAQPLPDYDGVRDRSAQLRAQRQRGPGNPVATRDALLRVVDADTPPLRLLLGDGPLAVAVADYESRLREWREWEPVSRAAQGHD